MTQAVSQSVPVPPGLVDIHSHLIPGIDDGCREIEESIACVRRLMAAGFVGSICTPHVWLDRFPSNTPENIRAWTQQVQQALSETGINYRVWPGAEVRIVDGAIEALSPRGLPTLAGSRCILVDYWEDRWHKWLETSLRRLIQDGYQPILAHPERIHRIKDLDQRLRDLEQMGVWLQGNFRSMTGEEGYVADQTVRQLLTQGRYRLLAMDMHVLDTLESRLDGMELVRAEFGPETVERLAGEAPRKLILGPG
jgi:protein-tyrosine phosphatase